MLPPPPAAPQVQSSLQSASQHAAEALLTQHLADQPKQQQQQQQVSEGYEQRADQPQVMDLQEAAVQTEPSAQPKHTPHSLPPPALDPRPADSPTVQDSLAAEVIAELQRAARPWHVPVQEGPASAASGMQDAQLSPMSSWPLQQPSAAAPAPLSLMPSPPGGLALQDAQTSAISIAGGPQMREAQLSPMASLLQAPQMQDAHTSAVSMPQAGPEMRDAQLSPMSSLLCGDERAQGAKDAQASWAPQMNLQPAVDLQAAPEELSVGQRSQRSAAHSLEAASTEVAAQNADAQISLLATPVRLADASCQCQLEAEPMPGGSADMLPPTVARPAAEAVPGQLYMQASRLGPAEAADNATQTSGPLHAPLAAGASAMPASSQR